MSHIDIISDLADKKLRKIPDYVLQCPTTKMLYLERNNLEFLPDDFFWKLPKLTWLDLRNNKLREVPSSIAKHEFLETLLLQDNELQELPDELGLVPKLKVLQIAGNPLRYPPEDIIKRGTKMICAFLREKYNRNCEPDESQASIKTDVSQRKYNSATNKSLKRLRRRKMTIQELLRASSRTAMAMGGVWPVISIKSLGDSSDSGRKKTVADVFFLPKPVEEKLSTDLIPTATIKPPPSNSKRALPPEDKLVTTEDVEKSDIKDVWLTKLKQVLNEQEDTLQQEKNLKALSSWRLQKKKEPLRKSDHQLQNPYDTDPEYETMVSRKDKDLPKKSKPKRKASKIDHNLNEVLSDVIDQLKMLENTIYEPRSPRSAQDIAEKQIQTINQLQKKILEIRTNENIS